MIHSSFDRVATQFLCVNIFQSAEQFGLADHAAFERFIEAGAEFAVGQSGQHRGIDQDYARDDERFRPDFSRRAG